jgi:hypothetical protein
MFASLATAGRAAAVLVDRRSGVVGSGGGRWRWRVQNCSSRSLASRRPTRLLQKSIATAVTNGQSDGGGWNDSRNDDDDARNRNRGDGDHPSSSSSPGGRRAATEERRGDERRRDEGRGADGKTQKPRRPRETRLTRAAGSQTGAKNLHWRAKRMERG